MKTVGQIIKNSRQKRGLSIDQLSHLTKIDAKYIEALESDRYLDLPSETFAKGFIRNLCQRLDLNPNELVAIFRRDFREPEHSDKVKKHRHVSIPGRSSQILPFAVGGTVFLVYLIFQFRVFLTPPKLEIIKPLDGAVQISPIEIEGDVSIDSTVLIGEDTRVNPDSAGHFLVRINLPVGETVLEVKAINRFSRSTTRKIPITIISK